jgi:signal transduction histidine kinase
MIFFILGWACIRLSRETHDVSVVWVATAFATCVVLRLCRSRGEAILVSTGVFVGGFFANLLGGSSAQFSAWFAIINIVDVAVAYELARKYTPRRFLTLFSGLKFLMLAGIVPTIAGALGAGLLLYSTGNADASAEVKNWFLANLLGFFIVAPLGMTLSLREIRKQKLGRRKLELAGTAAAVIATTVLVFLIPEYSPLFLIIPAGLWATVRFRLLGATGAILLSSLVAFISHRIFGSMTLSDPALAPYIFQLLVVVCAMTFVPVAALLNERDFHLALIERRRQRATQANKFKSQLLSHVSHEVRTPLSAIVGFGSLMESGMLVPEKAPEFAGIITRNGELLTRLHDDLMDMARAEAGRLVIDRKPIDASATLASFIKRQIPQPEAPALILEAVDDGLALSADPLRLTQIMNNLVGNAQRYGDGVSPVVITARKLDDRFGRIEVVNVGPGIRPEHRALVFQPFSRLDNGKPDVTGTGLGLSITKMLVEKHGGRIDFDSVPGGRTRFWIDLPLAA